MSSYCRASEGIRGLEENRVLELKDDGFGAREPMSVSSDLVAGSQGDEAALGNDHVIQHRDTE